MIERKSTKNLFAESFRELSTNKPADKITVKEICKNCGLTAPTFYNHFRDKYDLIAWIYSTRAEEIMNKIDIADYKLKDSIRDVIKYFFDNKDFLKNLLMNTSGQNSFINYISQFHAKILSDYIKRNKKIKTLPPEIEILVKVYCYGTVCTLCEILLKPVVLSTDKLVKIFADAIPEPLKNFIFPN